MPEPRRPLPRNGPSYQVVGIRFQTRSAPARDWDQETSTSSQPPWWSSSVGSAIAAAGGSAPASAPAAAPPSTARRVISVIGTSLGRRVFQGEREDVRSGTGRHRQGERDQIARGIRSELLVEQRRL